MEKEIKEITKIFEIVKVLNRMGLIHEPVSGIKGVPAITVEVNNDEMKEKLRSFLTYAGYKVEERNVDTWYILASSKLVMVMFFEGG